MVRTRALALEVAVVASLPDATVQASVLLLRGAESGLRHNQDGVWLNVLKWYTPGEMRRPWSCDYLGRWGRECATYARSADGHFEGVEFRTVSLPGMDGRSSRLSCSGRNLSGG